MGLGLDLRSDKDDFIKTAEFLDKYFREHSLSNTFGSMLGRDDVVEGETELFQIGRITEVDITPIFQMANYINEELEFVLDGTENEEERHRILYSAPPPKGSLKDNIHKVLLTINQLIDKALKVENLTGLLDDHGYDTLDYDNYFTDFNIDKGDGYIGNNFGQDLRNLKKSIEFAKGFEATTIYFGFN